jgi:hypothetical protein
MSPYANFDGAQGTVVVSGYEGVQDNRQRSISFWIRTTQEDLSTVCWWGDDLTTREVLDGSESRVRLIGGHIELFGKGSGRKSASPVNDGNFHHVVCSWALNPDRPDRTDFQTAKVVIDGVDNNGDNFGQSRRIIFPDGTERTTTAIDTPGESEIVIGARPDGSGGYKEFFQGDLDEFAVYNDVVSSGTISGAYNEGTPGADLLALGQVPALQFWYRMGDDPADVAPSGTLPPGTFVDQNPFTKRNAVVSSGVTISG